MKKAKQLFNKVLSFQKENYSYSSPEEEDYSFNTVRNHSYSIEDDTEKLIEEWLDIFSSMKGQRNIKLEIGNIGIIIACSQKPFIEQVRKDYKQFFSLIDQSYMIRCKISLEDYLQFFQKITFPFRLDHKEINIISCSNGWHLFFLPDTIALYDEAMKNISVLLHHVNTVSFDSLLRIIYSYLALENEGFLLHSTGLKVNKNGYAFYGPSQSGKSTVAQLAEKSCEVLSDELTLIRKEKGEFKVFSTPFIGTNSQKGINSSYHLKALFLLRKDDSNYIKRISKRNAIRHLLANILFFGNHPHHAEQVLHIGTLLVNSIPSYELHFTLDDSFLRYINDIH